MSTTLTDPFGSAVLAAFSTRFYLRVVATATRYEYLRQTDRDDMADVLRSRGVAVEIGTTREAEA